MKIDRINLIKQTFLQEDPPQFSEKGLKSGDREVMELAKDKMRVAKTFFLSVDPVQKYYNKIQSQKQIHDTMTGEFQTPFNETFFVFDEPVNIRWRDGYGNNDYVKKPLMGILLFPLFDKESTQKAKTKQGNIIELWSRLYRAVLFFEEDNDKVPGVPKDVVLLGEQYINFSIGGVRNWNKNELMVGHMNHTPCGNKLLCHVKEDGNPKYDSKKAWVCDEIVVRDEVVYLIQKIINNIYDIQVVKKKPNRKSVKKTVIPKNTTKSTTPMMKPEYSQYLSDKRYKYDPKDINYGTGTRHRHQYDVRRHPRIVGNKITWVSPYLRGKGSYLPKIYTNGKKSWMINYLWRTAEGLSKIRIIEIIMIRAIKFLKNKN